MYLKLVTDKPLLQLSLEEPKSLSDLEIRKYDLAGDVQFDQNGTSFFYAGKMEKLSCKSLNRLMDNPRWKEEKKEVIQHAAVYFMSHTETKNEKTRVNGLCLGCR